MTKKRLDSILKAQSVAVIGASDDLAKVGGRVVYLLQQRNFAGEIFLSRRLSCEGVKNNTMSKETYRPDIDGLRAVAVLAVVIYHAFPAALPGGFCGVDIFFVISGYLISGILFKSLSNGTFSFAEFYSRRIRRLFPALVTMFFLTLFAGY